VGSRARGHALVFIWESGGAHSDASDCADCAPRAFRQLWAIFWAKLAAWRVAWSVHYTSPTRPRGHPVSSYSVHIPTT
jgi:hypothetical protein